MFSLFSFHPLVVLLVARLFSCTYSHSMRFDRNTKKSWRLHGLGWVRWNFSRSQSGCYILLSCESPLLFTILFIFLYIFYDGISSPCCKDVCVCLRVQKMSAFIVCLAFTVWMEKSFSNKFVLRLFFPFDWTANGFLRNARESELFDALCSAV